MSKVTSEVKEVSIGDLIPFRIQSSQTYEGDRLDQLMSSIERVGLMNPIIVRPVDDGKYEIICGHNRAKAMSVLGHDVIRADVKYGLSDDEALELFYDSNLNQQAFSDWSYEQKIKAVKYLEKMIKETSQQGKRTDLEKKRDTEAEDRTCVQSRQKLNGVSKRTTTRDKMAHRLGIATATLSKYRSIIKLPDDLVESLAQLLDEKRITFEAAYRISGLKPCEAKMLVDYINGSPDKKIDMDKLKAVYNRSKNTIAVHSRDQIQEILISKESAILAPITRNRH